MMAYRANNSGARVLSQNELAVSPASCSVARSLFLLPFFNIRVSGDEGDKVRQFVASGKMKAFTPEISPGSAPIFRRFHG